MMTLTMNRSDPNPRRAPESRRRAQLALLTGLAVLLAGCAAPEEVGEPTEGTPTPDEPAAPTELTVEGHDENGEYWFTVEGSDERNPTITLPAGEDVMVRFVNVGTTVHNLHFGDPVNQATDLIEPDQEAWLNFTVPSAPADAAEYWCDPHRELGMVGPLRIE